MYDDKEWLLGTQMRVNTAAYLWGTVAHDVGSFHKSCIDGSMRFIGVLYVAWRTHR